jgi:hypothetical protein
MADSTRDVKRCGLTSKVRWRWYSALQEVGLGLGRDDLLEQDAVYGNDTTAVTQQKCARRLHRLQFLPIAV